MKIIFIFNHRADKWILLKLFFPFIFIYLFFCVCIWIVWKVLLANFLVIFSRLLFVSFLLVVLGLFIFCPFESFAWYNFFNWTRAMVSERDEDYVELNVGETGLLVYLIWIWWIDNIEMQDDNKYNIVWILYIEFKIYLK